MTLLDTVKALERIAAAQPSVNMIVRNDILRLNATPDAKYGVFGWTQQQHVIRTDSDLQTFSFALFYVDRLSENKRNETEIQSVGVQTLTNVIRGLEFDRVFTESDWTIQTFTQRFLDECAGCWATVRLQVSAGMICNSDYGLLTRKVRII